MTQLPLKCAQLGKALGDCMLGMDHLSAEAADSLGELHCRAVCAEVALQCPQLAHEPRCP